MISVGGTFSIPLDSSVEFEFTPRRSSAASGSALPLRDYIADDENALLRTLLPALERDSDLLCPLLLCGPSGTGKTALAVALAEQWKRAHPTGKVLLLTAVDFARAYAHAVDTNSLAELRERFLQASLIVIDDLPHLEGKTAAQTELRYLLDALIAQRVRLIITSRSAPAELAFAADVRGRLSQGLVLPLRWPGNDARREIIRRYLTTRRANHLTDAAVARFAEAYQGPPARLFAALAEVVHAAEAEHRHIDDALIDELLDRRHAAAKLAPKTIIACVAKHFRVTVKELKGPSRRQAITTARGVAMHLLRQHTRQTYEQIGQHFAGRDHTTVMHACQKTTERLANDGQLQRLLEQITAQLEEAA